MQTKLTKEEKEIAKKKDIIFKGWCFLWTAIIIRWIVRWVIVHDSSVLATIIVVVLTLITPFSRSILFIIFGGSGLLVAEWAHKYYDQIMGILLLIGLILIGWFLFWMFAPHSNY